MLSAAAPGRSLLNPYLYIDFPGCRAQHWHRWKALWWHIVPRGEIRDSNVSRQPVCEAVYKAVEAAQR